VEAEMSAHRAVVWIDHQEARIFDVAAAGFDPKTVSAPAGHVRRHPRDGKAAEHAHPDDRRRFFDEVAKALDGFVEILLVGPASAKLELYRHLHRHAPKVEAKIVGIETADHPTDGQLVSHARHYFGVTDRVTPSGADAGHGRS
jgi:stalled ribosome rescue protein Dom34